MHPDENDDEDDVLHGEEDSFKPEEDDVFEGSVAGEDPDGNADGIIVAAVSPDKLAGSSNEDAELDVTEAGESVEHVPAGLDNDPITGHLDSGAASEDEAPATGQDGDSPVAQGDDDTLFSDTVDVSGNSEIEDTAAVGESWPGAVDSGGWIEKWIL